MQHMEWFENLPDNCPPEMAYPPTHATFYRVVEYSPPQSKDFLCHKKRFPRINFADKCISSALSIFTSLYECSQMLLLPRFKNRKNSGIIRLNLPPESGVVLHTPNKNKTHYSWWRSKQFDPLLECKEVERIVYQDYIQLEK